MRAIGNIAEILAPAGSYEGLKAAIGAGADAVYVGGAKFGARAYANNLTKEELLEAIDFCHLHDRKLYLTVNTLLKDTEMAVLYDYLQPFYEQGLDALIVQDIGVLAFVNEYFPDLDVHASTQMTITGTGGAEFLKQHGAARVVTARELSLAEIKQIHETVDVEIESFVHGALCYSYSGQCLYSSLIGGRSGNRGRCAQPCRMPYEAMGKKGFLLSPKDICTLDILPDILESGVYSLKIEGRMKRAEYAAGVVSIYRKYLDHYLIHGRNGYQVAKEDKRQLMALYNRGGFTTGYYQMRNGAQMISLSRANHFGTEAAKVIKNDRKQITLKALEDLHKHDVLEDETIMEEVLCGQNFRVRSSSFKTAKPGMILHRTKDAALLAAISRQYMQTEIKEKINGKLIIKVGEPVILSIMYRDEQVSVQGEMPQYALKQPLVEENVRRQITKTGNTPFIFETLKITIEGEVFLPLQSLNELRRQALEQLTAQIQMKHRRTPAVTENQTQEQPVISAGTKHKINVSIEELELFDTLNEISEISGIYLDSSSLSVPLNKDETVHYITKCHERGRVCGYIMPPIFREETGRLFRAEENIDILKGFDVIIIKNYEQWQFFTKENWEKPIILDHNVYTFNKTAKYFSKANQITADTAPVELNFQELKNRGCETSELIVYGHLPMMTTAQCLHKTISKCTRQKEVIWLKDRLGKFFPVKNNCNLCYNTIYNQVPLHLLTEKERVNEIAPARLRLNFTIETKEEATAVARAYIDAFIWQREEKDKITEFTKGHFRRGVE